MKMTLLDRKLQDRLLSGRRAEGDWLVLADAVLLGALDGSRPLTAGERAALQGSPLSLRRLRQLALERRAAQGAANDAPWIGSAGMLRAADSGSLAGLGTDDGCFLLHFVGKGGAWRVILQLSASAPFAARLLDQQPLLEVLDGAGQVVLRGSLDSDGECEAAWPFDAAPASHFQSCGARFSVRLATP